MIRRSITWYFLGRVLSMGSRILLLPVYTRFLDPAELGTAMVVLAVGGVISLIVAPGTETVFLRWSYRKESQGNGRDGTLFIAHAVILGAGLLLLWLLGDVVGQVLLPGIPLWPFYDVILVTIGLVCLSAPIRADWRTNNRGDKVAVLELVQATISMITVLVALILFRAGPISLLLGDLVAAFLFAPICIHYIVPRLLYGWDGAVWKAVAPTLFVGVPFSFATWGLSSLDRVLLNRFLGPADVGLYAVGYMVGAAAIMVTIILNKEWEPLVYRAIAEHPLGTKWLQRLWQRSLLLVVVLSATIALFAHEIIYLLLGSQYAASSTVVPLIAVVAMFKAPHMFLHNLSLARGRLAALTTENVLSLTVFTVSNLILIPLLGILGAAWAAVAAYASGTLFMYSRSWNVYRLNRIMIIWIFVAASVLVISLQMPGTLVALVGGVLMSGFLVREAKQYWVFLGSLDQTVSRDA